MRRAGRPPRETRTCHPSRECRQRSLADLSCEIAGTMNSTHAETITTTIRPAIQRDTPCCARVTGCRCWRDVGTDLAANPARETRTARAPMRLGDGNQNHKGALVVLRQARPENWPTGFWPSRLLRNTRRNTENAIQSGLYGQPCPPIVAWEGKKGVLGETMRFLG
jgi:hypothetical protein